MKKLRYLAQADQLIRTGYISFYGCQVALLYIEEEGIPRTQNSQPRDFTICISRELGPGQQILYIDEALNALEDYIKTVVLLNATNDDEKEVQQHDGGNEA